MRVSYCTHTPPRLLSGIDLRLGREQGVYLYIHLCISYLFPVLQPSLMLGLMTPASVSILPSLQYQYVLIHIVRASLSSLIH
ncbi:hypothetical protein BDQ12DRAFT_674257 [Crucibulum laeve]|uniref:Uncharacterized protein n=1 Tax=Crucibulum laeve TaxID=68775 RepID=A0A5C3MCI2_9AGAR|nr:hypothetical protein BDQ12DRAFT_674257 [Crucibulum laeve]